MALIAGCGGRMQNVTPPIARDVPATGTTGTLTFTIVRPKTVNPKTKSYVSPASKSLWISFHLGTKVSVQVFALSESDKYCVEQPRGLVCTFSLLIPVGSYTSFIQIYDELPVNGKIPKGAHLLSQALGVKYTINAGQTTTIYPTLKGVIASLAISNFPQGCNINAFGPTGFTVAGGDADGYTIAGYYAVPITLSDSDTTGSTTLAVSGPDNPPADTLLSSSDTSTIAWNGNSLGNAGGATITASVAKGASTSATLWAGPGDVMFYYTGSPQYQTVSPCAISSVTIWAWGAQGGSLPGSPVVEGGYGGLVVATIPATSGQQLEVVVGGAGGSAVPNAQGAAAGGYNGGANGTTCHSSTSHLYFCKAYGGGGGGATDVRQGGTQLNSRVIVAGGGGGATGIAAVANTSGSGGGGGGLSGAAGGNGSTATCEEWIPPYSIIPGAGGTQTSGGKGGGDGQPKGGINDGSSGSGGPGEYVCAYSPTLDSSAAYGTGGGGGGWYGGGGGYDGAPGGGGSGYAEPSATNVLMQTGFTAGPGLAEICWPYSTDCKVTLSRLRHGKSFKPIRR